MSRLILESTIPSPTAAPAFLEQPGVLPLGAHRHPSPTLALPHQKCFLSHTAWNYALFKGNVLPCIQTEDYLLYSALFFFDPEEFHITSNQLAQVLLPCNEIHWALVNFISCFRCSVAPSQENRWRGNWEMFLTGLCVWILGLQPRVAGPLGGGT